MGCAGSKKGPESLARPDDIQLSRGAAIQGKPKVWGDYFTSETRAVLAVLKLAKIDHDFQLVDTLKDEHKQESYLK